ncbi:CMRF35-like molecule 3 isoform X2 [Mugil cephalus]|uniref:CMRF35-like molecule 3 isoform X2 n=1 Tax=Mugil cephalus TaxID=48193 RepID=UPI001FB670E3|nr:CMRF35-like molecule 3 isoform X2 [Mugil cephalus]
MAKMRTISIFYCLLYVMSTEGTTIETKGVVGGEVSFKCAHKLASSYNKYLCLDPCHDGDKLAEVAPGGRTESGRIRLVDRGDSAFTVTISQLRLSDSRIYWCGVARPGLDTYTKVILWVEEVLGFTSTNSIASETTSVTPDVSSTSSYENVTNLTQLMLGIHTSGPTNISSASNFTEEGKQNISTGTILYVITGSIFMLMVLILSLSFRKCRGIFKAQPQVCCSSTGPSNALESEVDCDYDDIDENLQCVENISDATSVSTSRPKQDPTFAASMAAECEEPPHIYENISFPTINGGSRCSPAASQKHHKTTSRIYIRPLSSERADAAVEPVV